MSDIDPTGNIIIALGALSSLGYLCYKIRKPFKNHNFNTFAYIILLLIVYSLIGKKRNITPKSSNVLHLRRLWRQYQDPKLPCNLSKH